MKITPNKTIGGMVLVVILGIVLVWLAFKLGIVQMGSVVTGNSN
jgi:hypothetical protein